MGESNWGRRRLLQKNIPAMDLRKGMASESHSEGGGGERGHRKNVV